MNITDFNFTSGNRVDQIAFYEEGSFTVPAKPSGSSFAVGEVNLPTGESDTLYPSMLLLSKDGSTWYAADSLPPSFGMTGGMAASPGNMLIRVFVTDGFTGQLRYRALGVYND